MSMSVTKTVQFSSDNNLFAHVDIFYIQYSLDLYITVVVIVMSRMVRNHIVEHQRLAFKSTSPSAHSEIRTPAIAVLGGTRKLGSSASSDTEGCECKCLVSASSSNCLYSRLRIVVPRGCFSTLFTSSFEKNLASSKDGSLSHAAR